MNTKETEYYEGYEVSSVCKEDLEEYFTKKQIAQLDDDNMRYIAKKMGDAICNCCYWVALEEATKNVLEAKKEYEGKVKK